MIKLKLYGSTKRVGTDTIQITEKLDGSNLGIFRIDDKLLIAQRNWVMVYPDDILNKQIMYKGLLDWLDKHGAVLRDSLINYNGVFGEWMGMGRLKNDDARQFNIFSKGKLRLGDDNTYYVDNMRYDVDNLNYVFNDGIVPDIDSLTFVPVVTTFDTYPDIDTLDALYEDYINVVGRDVEGFIVTVNGGNPRKYVRNKSGSVHPHYVRRD